MMARGISLIGLDHVLAVVAEECFVNNNMRANLNVSEVFATSTATCSGCTWTQRGTVTTHIETSVNDGRMIRIRTPDEDRHLLGIGTEEVEGFC